MINKYFEIWGVFFLIGGLNGLAFTVVLLTTVIQIVYKNIAQKQTRKTDNEPIFIDKIRFVLTLGPNGTVIIMVS